MGRRPHECLTEDCPCYRCSGCNKRWLARNNLLRHQLQLPCSNLPQEQKANDGRVKPSNSTYRRLGSWALLNSNGATKIKPKLGELLKSLEVKKQDVPQILGTLQTLQAKQFSKLRFKFERPVVKAGRKPHECLTDDCPCYKCSGCNKKWTKRFNLEQHQRHQEPCASRLSQEQKSIDSAPKSGDTGKRLGNWALPSAMGTTRIMPKGELVGSFDKDKVTGSTRIMPKGEILESSEKDQRVPGSSQPKLKERERYPSEKYTERAVVKAFTTDNPHVLVCSLCGKYVRRSRGGVHIALKHKGRMQIVHEDQDNEKHEVTLKSATIAPIATRGTVVLKQGDGGWRDQKTKRVKAFKTNNPHVLKCSLCKKYLRVMKVHMTKVHNAEMEVVDGEDEDDSAKESADDVQEAKPTAEMFVVKAEPSDFEFVSIKTEPEDDDSPGIDPLMANPECKDYIGESNFPNVQIKEELDGQDFPLEDENEASNKEGSTFQEMVPSQTLILPRSKHQVSCPFPGCRQELSSQEDFETHMTSCHPGPAAESQPATASLHLPQILPLPKLRLGCPAHNCRADFCSKEELLAHIGLFHPDIHPPHSLVRSSLVSLPCPSLGCTMDFTSDHDLRKHIDNCHSHSAKKLMLQDTRYCCDFCAYTSKQKGNLKQHLKVKHPGDRYQCMYCQFKVNWKGTYIIHLKESHAEEMATQGLGTTEESNPLLSFNGTIALSCNGEIATTL